MYNRSLAIHVIEEILRAGTKEFVVCPSSRNAPFVNLLSTSNLKVTYWPEERSAAFFALGRSRALSAPVAVITTSGTAVGELFPALMESYYTCTPLIAVTADRPRRFRGTGAPQTADQEGIFGVYTPISFDLEGEEKSTLSDWDRQSPLHYNVCFEDPAKEETPHQFSLTEKEISSIPADPSMLIHFLSEVESPLVVVSGIPLKERRAVADFLLKMKAPVYLESTSGLRGDERLLPYRVFQPDLTSHDSVLRIGAVPTHRLWRDLEVNQDDFRILSISEYPFSGLSASPIIPTLLAPFFNSLNISEKKWKLKENYFEIQKTYQERLSQLLKEEPLSEPGLVAELGAQIPPSALVYLGNSLPIREWDLTMERGGDIFASRGLNGIDGQLSTFFGLSDHGRMNVAIIGDLTALYDLAAPWCLRQLSGLPFCIIVVNNGGGKIFDRMYPNKNMQNEHALSFEHFAHFWNIPYLKLTKLPDQLVYSGLIEIIPDEAATKSFWTKYDALKKTDLASLVG